MYKSSSGRIAFQIVNTAIILFCCLLIVIPLWNIIITSVAQDKDVINTYLLFPKSFTMKSYMEIAKSSYLRSFIISLVVTVVGVSVSMSLTLPLGYALAQKGLRLRNTLMKLILLTYMFDAGIIPTYMLIKSLGLINSYAALVLPMALSTYNLILVRNYFAFIPESLIESARLDGCSEIGILLKIVIPVSVPILAAVSLFYAISYWNRYLEVVMYINSNNKYTLQVLLRQLMFDESAAGGMPKFANFKMAVMLMAILPVAVLYPFIQRYFISGIMLGSVKG